MKSVVELVKTPSGYSVVENGLQMNRLSNKNSKQKTYAVPKKFTQQTFTIYPYLYHEGAQEQENHKYIILPAKAQWFNLNQIHQIEKKALPEWFKTRKVLFGAIKSDKFEKNQELYLKYRNHIIELGKKCYVSPTRARKGLAGDACAIIRIHNFLEGWGLINYVYPKHKNTHKSLLSQKEQSKINLRQRKDCIDKDKSLAQKNYDKDHLQLLKKITKKYRPICQLCEGICGVAWYQYQEKLFLKEFKQKQNNGKSLIESSSSPFYYKLRICASCLSNGNIPIIFSIENFEKKNIVDELKYTYEEPKDRKKIAEQNKMLETIQKNKFSLKKSADLAKIQERELYESLMYIPLVKIEKMSRIDQEPETQEEIPKERIQEEAREIIMNGVSQDHFEQKEALSDKLVDKLKYMDVEQIELYEDFTQLWLRKIITQTQKLDDWQKSVRWYFHHLLQNQKNKLAQTLKNI